MYRYTPYLGVPRRAARRATLTARPGRTRRRHPPAPGAASDPNPNPSPIALALALTLTLTLTLALTLTLTRCCCCAPWAYLGPTWLVRSSPGASCPSMPPSSTAPHLSAPAARQAPLGLVSEPTP